MDPPTTVKGVRSFLGAVNYYRAYIENCSAIARPLTKLTHKNATFNWDDDCQHAFDYLKDKLIEAPILGYPDVSKTFFIIYRRERIFNWWYTNTKHRKR